MERRLARVMCVLALVAIVGLVLATAVDPGSGTGTNLQAADDVASLVIGAHHAKPVPASGAVVVGLLLLAAALVSASVVTQPAPGFVVPRSRDDAHPPRRVVASSGRAWRAPPAPCSA